MAKQFKKRLFSVSRELKVSTDNIVQHLKDRGYVSALDGAGLNASITDEEAYDELLEFFAKDKAAAVRLREKRAAREAEERVAQPALTLDVEDEVEEEAPPPPGKKAPEAPPAEPEIPVVEAPEAEVPEPVAEEVAPPEEPPIEAPEEVAAPEAVEEEVPAESAPAPEPVAEEEEVAEAAAPPEPEPVAAQPPAEERRPKERAPERSPAQREAPQRTEPGEASAAQGDGAQEQAPAARPQEAPEAEPAEAPAARADTEEEKDESVISAKRYQLAGTKVVGKVDLTSIEEDRPAKKKRKRKRKSKAASTDEGKVQIADRAATKETKESPATAAKKKRKRKRGPAVDEEDVEATLQETLRELEVGASRARQRRRRQRRDRHAAEREREREVEASEERILRVTEFVSTGELANLMDVHVNEVISALFSAGMIVSINQRLDADTITFVADEFGYDVEFITDFGAEDIVLEEDDPADLRSRPPIVTVMGHVDHGKTSLLDYIRKANVVAGEAGGITQHIGAYRVEAGDGREVTFLDTPGHEAFTAMRARGAKVTDVVILVVAADDAVMPQTVEAINHARAAEVPIIVAINKIDKPEANPPRVMQQLADQNVLVEQYGGKVQCALVSAKTGEGVDELLERVLLEAELLEVQANPDRNASGIVIESRLEKGRGNVATVLVQNGTLEVGDVFVAGIYSGRVRAMFDERENRVDKVGPGQPALILGFNGSPEVGDQFIVLDDEKEARDIAQKRQQIHREQSLRQRKHITLDEIGRRLALGDFQELNIIVKGDVGGSVEALSDSLLKLSSEEVALNIIHSGVGAITESDVMLASASDAVIIGFQVRPVPGARMLAEREEIDIRLYSVIYDAIEDVRDALEGLLTPTKKEQTVGTVEVRDIFKVPKAGTVAGCYVVEGKIRRNDRIRVIRDGVVIYEGNIASLKRFKDDVREVQSGYECGISVENFNDIKVGDHLETYEIVEEKRKLHV